MDTQLRRAERRDPLSLAAFRERCRAGLVGGIPKGCRSCRGVGLRKAHPYDARCMTCGGTGEAPVEERLRMAAFLGHEEARWEYDKTKPPHPAECMRGRPLIEVVESRYGPVAAAACARAAADDSAKELLRIRKGWYTGRDVVVRVEDRAREAARQAGIRWALAQEP